MKWEGEGGGWERDHTGRQLTKGHLRGHLKTCTVETSLNIYIVERNLNKVTKQQGRWSTIDKSSGTGIGVQLEDPKSRTASHWLLPQPQSENHDPASRNLKLRLCLRAVSSHLIFLSRAGIKGVHHPVSTATSVGIKGMCCHCLVCKADQCGCFTLRSSGKLYLLKYKWNGTTERILHQLDPFTTK